MIREWNEATIKRFLKEGRGQGTGKDYKPWLQINDISSRSRTTRTFGHTTQRVHHLLSDLQLYYFYLLEFDENVIDIREQFPLLDFHEMDLLIDSDLSRKLFDSKTKVPHIFTTSFFVTKVGNDDDPYYQARIVKISSELEKKSTIERLELQRRYFAKKGIDFGIVTENEINKVLSKNIGWALAAYDIQDYPELTTNFTYLKNDLLLLLMDSNISFQQVFEKIENLYQLSNGLGLVLFKHLVARKDVQMDLTRKIYLTKKPCDYGVQVKEVINDDRNKAVGS
ncbi:heteromeric transposase endonuclease subunit TnsA [Bacillus andreraoultii]|uniref:heteromeric transposase endonuclease subunit TnsA n=1 Tax=Bacillus andreraoultii TaxID=1499685 RepID=UPI0005AA7A03|nr:heteromeric transposase endonuclease subunit TnsA [Bacillus andreraoultii]